jgi:phosphopantothenoylcysteine decarboxylase / phosphopantothenate---cysteine ligase
MVLLKDKKVLITAGPTREAIDPVRFISNHSSGKMGYAIAEALLKLGAKVTLISGPVNVKLKHSNLTVIPVVSAAAMYEASKLFFDTIDIVIFTAAVADYRPETVSERKIKKAGEELLIRLVKNIDIAFEFGKLKGNNQLSVGFALETNDEIIHAREKLQQKNFDMLILNSMNDAGAGFEYDTNKITIFTKDAPEIAYPVKHKTAVAEDILKALTTMISQRAYPILMEASPIL